MLQYFVVNATEVTENSTVETENDGWIPDTNERLGTTLTNDFVSLPSTYDPRQETFLTNVKDQGSTNLCWMYAAAGAAEQYVSKNYGTKFDISEAHAGVAFSNSIGSGGTGYYDNIANFGGNSGKALQYFTNWNTPIFNDNVYQWNSTVSDSSYPLTNVVLSDKTFTDSSFLNAQSLFNVTSAHYLNIRDTDSIKQAIKEYGSVVTGVSGNLSYGLDSNGDINAFSNVGSFITSHAIMFVGWDDNYSKDNFSSTIKPTKDGAWLVKNSYSNKGYYWLSYNEGSLFSTDNNVSVITGVQKATTNEHMLSYDYFIPTCNNSKYFTDDVYMYICVMFLMFQTIQIHIIKLAR